MGESTGHELGAGQPLQRAANQVSASTSQAAATETPLDYTAESKRPGEVAEYEHDISAHHAEDEEGSDWSNESLMEQYIGMIDDEDYKAADTECCSLTESKQLRQQLRQVGPEEFVSRNLESGAYTVRKLCTAFGAVFEDVDFLSTASDDVFLPLLGALMKKELTKRHRLEEYTTIDHAAKLLQECNNVIVITGAGISTNLGIPDFRSKGTGLYSRLEHLGLSDPQEVFDIHLFREDPAIFYSIAKDIVPATKRFSPTHAFIRLLQDKSKLLTNFTQNIDNLEEAAGVLSEKLIQCHGSFATATCQQCAFNCPGDQISDDLKAGRVARCPACLRGISQLQPIGFKRKHIHISNGSKKKQRRDFEGSSDSEEENDDMEVAGVMKPDITFFGEDLPKLFHNRLIQHDRQLVDLVIVIGTSLKVAPVADIPNFLPPGVPQIYISRDPVNHIEFDIELLGDCDQIVTELCRRAGWDFNHEMVSPGQVLEANPYSETSTTRWRMTPKDGSATTKREAQDSGTLGHGSALSPSQKRFGPQSASIAAGAKQEDAKLPVASIPEARLPETTLSVATFSNTEAIDPSKDSMSPFFSKAPTDSGNAANAAVDDDNADDSITLTPRSTESPGPPVDSADPTSKD
jgi:NAD+-dependent protein deacetylase SIR2